MGEININRVPQAMYKRMYKRENGSLMYKRENDSLIFNPFQYDPFLKLFEWKNDKWVWNGKNLCIFDEVGVGKTIEAGIILRQFMPFGQPSDRSVLILCPVKLLSNWETELVNKFLLTPTNYREDRSFGRITLLPYSYFTYNNASQTSDLIEEIRSEEENMLSATNEINQRLDDKINAIPEFDILIADEAHYLRDPDSIRHQAVSKLLQKHSRKGPIIFMTGTPIVNKPEDKEVLFRLITENGSTGFEHTENMQCQANRYDFAPEINLLEVKVESDDVQKKVLNLFLGGSAFEKPIPASSVYCAYKHFDNIIKSDDPLKSQADKAYAESAVSTIRESIREGGKTLSPEDFIDHDKKFQGFLGYLKEKLDQADNKAIVFCHYKDTMDFLEVGLRINNYRTFRIDGDTRFDIISDVKSEFQACSDASVLLCSDAAKEGHNLQFCNLMYHYDYAFTATDLAQRIGRIYRKGQTKIPMVFYVHVKGSYDDRMLDIVMGKAQLTENNGVVPLSSFVPQNKTPGEVRRDSFMFRYNELINELIEKKSVIPPEYYIGWNPKYDDEIRQQPFLNKFYQETGLDWRVMFKVLDEYREMLSADISRSTENKTIPRDLFYKSSVLKALFGDETKLSSAEILKKNQDAYQQKNNEIAQGLFGVSIPENFRVDQLIKQYNLPIISIPDNNDEGEDF